MTELGKVWAVSSGAYSDYGVDCIFETEEDAEAYRAAGGGERVECFGFFPAGIREKYLTVYTAGQYGTYLSIPGSSRPDPHVEKEIEIDEDGSLAQLYARPQVKVNKPYRGGPPDIFAKSTDPAAAVKAVKDRRASVEASGYNICPSCDGTGTAPSRNPFDKCRECDGRGWTPNAAPKDEQA